MQFAYFVLFRLNTHLNKTKVILNMKTNLMTSSHLLRILLAAFKIFSLISKDFRSLSSAELIVIS